MNANQIENFVDIFRWNEDGYDNAVIGFYEDEVPQDEFDILRDEFGYEMGKIAGELGLDCSTGVADSMDIMLDDGENTRRERDALYKQIEREFKKVKKKFIKKYTTNEAFEKPNGGKGYWYRMTHGFGPGTLPRDVEVLEHREVGYDDYVRLDKVLTTQELDFYDVQERKPPMEESNESFIESYESNDFVSKIEDIVRKYGFGDIDNITANGDFITIDFVDDITWGDLRLLDRRLQEATYHSFEIYPTHEYNDGTVNGIEIELLDLDESLKEEYFTNEDGSNFWDALGELPEDVEKYIDYWWGMDVNAYFDDNGVIHFETYEDDFEFESKQELIDWVRYEIQAFAEQILENPSAYDSEEKASVGL